MTPTCTLAQIIAELEQRYPPRTAEPWDAVGLVCGDPAQPIAKVMLAVDVTDPVVTEAIEWGADLLIAHHPLLLRPVNSVAATTWKGALVHRLIRANCALYTAHTNGDVAKSGVAAALADLLGLQDQRPLVPAAPEEHDKFVVFVPHADADVLADALSAAGAGKLGDYDRCAWTTEGSGTFRPLDGAQPTIGAVGDQEVVPETRVEMIAPRSRRAIVIEALRATHPYEEPAFDVIELAPVTDATTGLGRVGNLAEPATLGDFAVTVAKSLPATAQGIRVAGPLDARVQRVALVGGSGDGFFDEVRRAGADVYITSDIRHHPISELREQAEFEAAGGADSPPYIIDTAHFASEWPWLRLLADQIRSFEAAGAGNVEVKVSHLRTDAWTARVDSVTGEVNAPVE